jgi:hypothetical protein
VTEKEKLILAQMQVNNLLNLLQGNSYENYMCGKLHGIQHELKRQFCNLTGENYYSKIEVKSESKNV